MYGIIYKVTNTLNNHAYVGQTTLPIAERWRKHIDRSRESEPLGLAAAIKKYGAENFTIEQIDEANSAAELNEKEIYWIAHYNTFLGPGYNRTLGGEGAPILSLPIEGIKKDYLSGKFTLKELGKKYGCSDRTIRNRLLKEGVQIESHPQTEKVIKAQQENLAKGRAGRPENFINHVNSLKKKVAQLDSEGNVLATYDSLSAACRALGQATNHTNRITAAIANDTICFGYKWRRI